VTFDSNSDHPLCIGPKEGGGKILRTPEIEGRLPHLAFTNCIIWASDRFGDTVSLDRGEASMTVTRTAKKG
jgi:hypothetical protein